ncbi:hypothetical protein [Aquimarina algiphila]|uniref:hypothetical protein n=1 Tax=Aquimarina algiphila TaxID=2047982 RepID=UPI0023302CB9|nr:hypothetical protein [Aquimarina algiphila]
METTTNKIDNRTVKPYPDPIDIHTEVLQIYNIMPRGTRELAAQKYGCAGWYFKNLITDIKTDMSKMKMIVKSISEASSEHENNIRTNNKELQKMALDFTKKYTTT